MASSDEWKTALAASDRYQNIEQIVSIVAAEYPKKKGSAQQEAFEIESQAYQTATTRDEYNQACKVLFRGSPVLPADPSPVVLPPSSSVSTSSLTIGHYANCVEIGEGVTSTVYRSPGPATPAGSGTPAEGGYALKVVHSNPPEPHHPGREIKTLQRLSHASIIALLDTFRDDDSQIVLVFPFKPLTLSRLLDAGGPVPAARVRSITRGVLSGLAFLHEGGIIHRDLKPSAVLLDGPCGPAYLSDFGTVWHPEFSSSAEPPGSKILDIGTGAYRPPDALMGNRSYSTPVDMWSLGVLLSELASLSPTPTPIFTSPPTHEDGSQLGLILSIFRTLGTPTPRTWPEAAAFRTTPFGMWRVFEAQEDAFAAVDGEFRVLVEGILKYESGQRLTAKQALELECLSLKDN